MDDRVKYWKIVGDMNDRTRRAFGEYIADDNDYTWATHDLSKAMDDAVFYVMRELFMRMLAGQELEEAWFEIENGEGMFSLTSYFMDALDEAAYEHDDDWDEDEEEEKE